MIHRLNLHLGFDHSSLDILIPHQSWSGITEVRWMSSAVVAVQNEEKTEKNQWCCDKVKTAVTALEMDMPLDKEEENVDEDEDEDEKINPNVESNSNGKINPDGLALNNIFYSVKPGTAVLTDECEDIAVTASSIIMPPARHYSKSLPITP